MIGKTVYLNGEFMPFEKASIPVTTHALHYGTGVFEGIRAYYSEKENCLCVFRMEDHFRRMEQSCKIMMIEIPSVEKLCDLTKQLLKKNFESTDLYIRPLAYKADTAVGNFNLSTLKDGLLIYTTPMGRYMKSDGIRAQVSSWTRISDNMIPPRGKITGAYANTSLAKTESLLNGYDEAIFLDKDGHVVEGSSANIFLVKDKKILTPSKSSDILVGITRDTIMTLCRNELNKEVEERNIDRSELYQADEIFLVGTAAEVTPVVEVDKRRIVNGKPGTVVKQLQELFSTIRYGDNPNYKDWITKIKQ